jgi:hypothetical protein
MTSSASTIEALGMVRRLEVVDMDEAARVFRTAFDQALPGLAGLHTPEEDRWFFRERVFTTCEVWGVFDRAAMTGMICLPAGLDRSVIRAATGSAARIWHRIAAGRAAFF